MITCKHSKNRVVFRANRTFCALVDNEHVSYHECFNYEPTVEFCHHLHDEIRIVPCFPQPEVNIVAFRLLVRLAKGNIGARPPVRLAKLPLLLREYFRLGDERDDKMERRVGDYERENGARHSERDSLEDESREVLSDQLRGQRQDLLDALPRLAERAPGPAVDSARNVAMGNDQLPNKLLIEDALFSFLYLHLEVHTFVFVLHHNYLSRTTLTSGQIR